MPLGLIALALGGFGIGLTEFVIVGLLPEVAADFAVSESTAGVLVSGYALGVALGAVALTIAVARMNRKHVLLGLMGLFVVGNLISALAPTYGMMLTGRVLAALCHGAFFGVGAVVAAGLVPANKKAGAISLLFAGLTVAMVLGVPAGTFLGQAAGWRSTFWAITVIGLVSLIGIATLVPATPASSADRIRVRDEIAIVTRPRVLVSALVSLLVSGGLVGAFTYISFTYTRVAGFSETTVPWLLLLFGAGTFIGNIVGGKLADRALNRSLVMILALASLAMASFALAAGVTAAAVALTLVMGMTAFAALPGLQLRIMSFAAGADALASGTNIAALNIGNALGVWLGGIVITTSLGFTGPLWVGAAFAALACALFVVSSGRATTAPVVQTPASTRESEPSLTH